MSAINIDRLTARRTALARPAEALRMGQCRVAPLGKGVMQATPPPWLAKILGVAHSKRLKYYSGAESGRARGRGSQLQQSRLVYRECSSAHTSALICPP